MNNLETLRIAHADLSALLGHSPTQRQLAKAVQRSQRWVNKWLPRAGIAPNPIGKRPMPGSPHAPPRLAGEHVGHLHAVLATLDVAEQRGVVITREARSGAAYLRKLSTWLEHRSAADLGVQKKRAA